MVQIVQYNNEDTTTDAMVSIYIKNLPDLNFAWILFQLNLEVLCNYITFLIKRERACQEYLDFKV